MSRILLSSCPFPDSKKNSLKAAASDRCEYSMQVSLHVKRGANGSNHWQSFNTFVTNNKLMILGTRFFGISCRSSWFAGECCCWEQKPMTLRILPMLG